MANSNEPQRFFFTCRRNGDNNGKRLVEITAEAVARHGAPVEAKQSWFGAEDDVAAALAGLDFPAIDVEGVIGALHTNRVATREIDVLPSDLLDVGFKPSA